MKKFITTITLLACIVFAYGQKMEVSSGAYLTINQGAFITITSSLVNNGSIVIKSNASGTGSLIQSSTDVNATMERYMNGADWGTWKDGWHFLSAPVASQTISPTFTTDPYDFYLWNEPTNEWVNFKNQNGGGGTAPYFDVVNGSNNFELGRGYMAAYDVAGVKSFVGKLNVADVSVSGLGITSSSENKSWHLLGNPYSSALTWDASTAWNLTNIAGVAKIWNEANQSYTDLTSSPATTIPATNGFMVQVSSGTGSLTIPAAKRVHSAQAFYKSAVSGFTLTAISHTAGNAQEAKIIVNPESTVGYDLMFDSEFLAGHAPVFYSLAGELKLSTNSLPLISPETEIPFVFMKNDGAQYSIEAIGIENMPETPYLIDLRHGVSQSLTENPVYTFTSSAGDDPNRFLLKFSAAGIEKASTLNSVNAWVHNNILYVDKQQGVTFVELLDVMGRTLYSRQITGKGLHNMNINQPVGVYLIRITNGGKVHTIKVLIH
jgi:hypothetical protein